MATNSKTVDWGGLTVDVATLRTGATAPGVQGTAVTSSAAELNYLDASSGPGAVVTSGTTAATEYRVGPLRITSLACTAFDIGDTGDNENLAFGAGLYELPAGNIMVLGASLVGTVDADISVTTDTPEIGVGNVVGAGANATLGAVDAGCENIAGPFVAADLSDGAVAGAGAASNTTGVLIATADDHTLFLNAADGWADVTAAGPLLFTGTITLVWMTL